MSKKRRVIDFLFSVVSLEGADAERYWLIPKWSDLYFKKG